MITATAESYEQARELLELGVDRIYIGEKAFGLRLPKPFSFAEMRKIAELVHESGKELTVAVNALMHQAYDGCSIQTILDFLKGNSRLIILLSEMQEFFMSCNRDGISIQNDLQMPQPWSLLAARSISGENKQELLKLFWLVRFHLPNYSSWLKIFRFQQKYWFTVLALFTTQNDHLLQNYYNFIKTDESVTKDRDLFLG